MDRSLVTGTRMSDESDTERWGQARGGDLKKRRGFSWTINVEQSASLCIECLFISRMDELWTNRNLLAANSRSIVSSSQKLHHWNKQEHQAFHQPLSSGLKASFNWHREPSPQFHPIRGLLISLRLAVQRSARGHSTNLAPGWQRAKNRWQKFNTHTVLNPNYCTFSQHLFQNRSTAIKNSTKTGS